MLASPIAKPFLQLTPFSLQLASQKRSKLTLCNKTRSYNYKFNCLWLGTSSTEWPEHYACMQTVQKKNKLQSSAKPTQTLKPFHHPCYSTRLPQMHTSPVSGRVPRHVFQARTPSRNSTKYRADDLCGNLICKYFCWMLGDPHSFSADHFLFWPFPLY